MHHTNVSELRSPDAPVSDSLTSLMKNISLLFITRTTLSMPPSSFSTPTNVGLAGTGSNCFFCNHLAFFGNISPPYNSVTDATGSVFNTGWGCARFCIHGKASTADENFPKDFTVSVSFDMDLRKLRFGLG